MADSGRAFRQALDVVGKGYYTEGNKQNIALYAGLIYIGDSIKEAIAEAAKMWKGKQEETNGKGI